MALEFNITFLSHFLMGIIILLSYWKTRKSFKNTKMKTINLFSKYFLFFGLFLLIMGMPILLPFRLSGVALGAFYIIGHVSLYLSFAYFVRIPAIFVKPNWEKTLFYIYLVAGGIVTAANLFFYNIPEISNNIVLWNVVGPIGPMIGILAISSWVIGGTGAFIWLASKSEGWGPERVKMLLLAVGLLFSAIAGPMHDNVSTVRLQLIAETLTFVGIILQMSGIYYDQVLGKENVGFIG